MCRHLLSLAVFEILVSFLVRLAQGVEYNNLPILRIDAKYNPVAYDAQAAQLKQYGSHILNHKKW